MEKGPTGARGREVEPGESKRGDEDLQSALTAAWMRGRRAFGALALDEGHFTGHLRRLVPGRPSAEAIAALAAEDVYLACACLAGVPEAAATLHSRVGAAVRAAIARVVPGPDVAEVEQRLMDAMLVGSVTSAPKLASYGGRSPLERWFSVAAQRRALMWLREYRTEARAHQRAAAEPGGAPPLHPEMAYLKERYRSDFERALRAALDRVPERDRALLRLHAVNGLPVEKISKIYGVSRPTASRWLAAARETLLADVKANLRANLGASSSELASLAGLVASGLDLSLSQLLRSR